MKKTSTKTIIVVFCVTIAMLFLTNNFSFAQAPPAAGHWQTSATGNPTTLIDKVTGSGNNFLGTNGFVSMHIGTTGNVSMVVADGGETAVTFEAAKTVKRTFRLEKV